MAYPQGSNDAFAWEKAACLDRDTRGILDHVYITYLGLSNIVAIEGLGIHVHVTLALDAPIPLHS